jgi:hypothetical protein
VNVGVDKASPNRVHTDALFSNLSRQADGQRIDRTLGGRVVDVLAR